MATSIFFLGKRPLPVLLTHSHRGEVAGSVLVLGVWLYVAIGAIGLDQQARLLLSDTNRPGIITRQHLPTSTGVAFSRAVFAVIPSGIPLIVFCKSSQSDSPGTKWPICEYTGNRPRWRATS